MKATLLYRLTDNEWECNIWITRNPKSLAGKELRAIVNMINQIKTHNERLYWTHLFQQ